MRLAAAPAALLAAGLALAPVAFGQAEAIEPTFQLDRKKDVRGPLDVVRVAMSTRTDGSLRGELTMRRAWEDSDVGTGGSLCLRLYVKAEPDAQPPDYLVCAVPDAAGTALTARVLRNRGSGLPKAVGDAAVTRPTTRTIYFNFDPSAIRTPSDLRFAGETVWRGSRCARATGCRDLAPDAPDARRFHLRRNGASG